MKHAIALVLMAVASAGPAAAAMTRDQKLADFRQLAGLYAKNYAPYEWKVESQKFDLLDIGAWLDRVARSQDDLEFYDICVEYVASLNDAHDIFELPSSFTASLGFSVDIYDGKAIIDSISRSQLPLTDFPFVTGDELVSLDGKPVEEWLQALWKYSIAANDRSTRRIAASLITFRPQMYIPRAHEIPDTASVVIRRQSGDEETYTIPWKKQGTPLTEVGPVPSPKAAGVRLRAAAGREAFYRSPLEALTYSRRSRVTDATIGVGARSPVFTVRPKGFAQRLGRSPSDAFYSGVFEAEGFRLGYLRIPDYDPLSQSLALQQFDSEIAYFRANTDGLILDQMRNPGGDACYAQNLLARLLPYRFRGVGFEIRATAYWVSVFSAALEAAKQRKAEPWVIALREARLKDVETAYHENRGRTGPLALCGLTLEVDPATDRAGNVTAYDKPLMVLVDEMSSSSADLFPAVIQDHGRGPIVGVRTMGAGGSLNYFDATTYSEGAASVTLSLMDRKWSIDSEGLPSAPYLENIGVHPDVTLDYMTLENFKTGGKPFLDGVVAAMVEWIRNTRPEP